MTSPYLLPGVVLVTFVFLLMYAARRRMLLRREASGPRKRTRHRRPEVTKDEGLLKAVKNAGKPGPIKFHGVDYLVVEKSDEAAHPRILWAVNSLQCTIASETGCLVLVNWEGNQCSMTVMNPAREDMETATRLLKQMLEEATRVLDTDGRLPILGVEITLGGYNEPGGIRPWNTGSS